MTRDSSNVWRESSRRKLKEALRPLPNVRVLENSEIQDFKEVSISALSPTYSYYELERKKWDSICYWISSRNEH